MEAVIACVEVEPVASFAAVSMGVSFSLEGCFDSGDIFADTAGYFVEC